MQNKNMVNECIALYNIAKEKTTKENFFKICDMINDSQKAIIDFAFDCVDAQFGKEDAVRNYENMLQNAKNGISTINKIGTELTKKEIIIFNDDSGKEIFKICCEYRNQYTDYMIKKMQDEENIIQEV